MLRMKPRTEVMNNCDCPLISAGSESSETEFFDSRCEGSTTGSNVAGDAHDRLVLSQRGGPHQVDQDGCPSEISAFRGTIDEGSKNRLYVYTRPCVPARRFSCSSYRISVPGPTIIVVHNLDSQGYARNYSRHIANAELDRLLRQHF